MLYYKSYIHMHIISLSLYIYIYICIITEADLLEEALGLAVADIEPDIREPDAHLLWREFFIIL